METVLRKATKEGFSLIKNLVPYYIYDMSGSMGWDPNEEGRYDGCDDLEEYWHKPDHHPYLIYVDGKIGGFTLIRPYPNEPDRMEIGEFFVLRKFQNRGVGKAAAFQLFDLYPGQWLVRVLDRNTGACCFWRKVIAGYTDGHFTQTSEEYRCPYSGTWPMQSYRFANGK